MDLHFQVMRARRRALTTCAPPSNPSPCVSTTPQPDPFAFELHGVYLPELPKEQKHEHDKPQRVKKRQVDKRTSNAKSTKSGVKKKSRRFVTNWTPEMDKVVRKGLHKFGWGNWTRIATSGKLPKEYNAKMIANRARALGLTKDMYGPQIVNTSNTRTKS